MTTFTRALNALGLMTRAEHEAEIAKWEDGAICWHDKFTAAIADLEKQAGEIEASKQDADRVQYMLDESEKLVSALTDKNVELIGKLQTADGKITGLERCIASLKPDALLWRNARDKRAKNRGGK